MKNFIVGHPEFVHAYAYEEDTNTHELVTFL